MQLERTGKQVKQEVLNNVSSTANKNTVPHCQLSLSIDAKILHGSLLLSISSSLSIRLPVLFLDQKYQFVHWQ